MTSLNGTSQKRRYFSNCDSKFLKIDVNIQLQRYDNL
jgi:hypothetical protein